MHNTFLPGITVFTPTYNRAKLLGRLYESLKSQSCPELEWLIVDDGSTDDTKQVVDAFTCEGQLKIRYIYKENGGKHTAMNVGIREAKHAYFLCIDSDDVLMPGALSALLAAIQDTPAGIIAYKENMETGKQIGDPFPEELSETTLIELINLHRCSGDRTLVYRTELLQPHKIPEPPAQRFFPETWLYDRIDEAHRCKLLPQALCSCEYQEGGYSHSFRQLMLRNSVSMKWFYADRLDMPLPLKIRFDAAYRYIAFSLLSPSPLGRYKGKRWLLLAAALPLGIAMALHYGRHRS
ncbi:MAG: glycosyltransferase family 2 protein [Oscillospiraceae bacterium]|nr:glycosyltransferase family 2 protein [Oscillospiraceae bacterium]